MQLFIKESVPGFGLEIQEEPEASSARKRTSLKTNRQNKGGESEVVAGASWKELPWPKLGQLQ